ncbi:MAG: LD-carboxypeptidase [Hydrococcus sp. C42_A2020_068]|uniref:S66 peptidase family protein n=1 Tax=Pleurocapsa sp. PCC 7327 TaxID=118163 RepID=UPI00029FD014|nr:LD-carboxypeptidase [Pleurocapsa sp. PCC 7327]AFY76613.1 putative MccF-like protein (microcin C7 resistance) [Pleurocapsa sp. PCC 7327]MBF2021639.1 LD-carboxypeptidase [Hydrococcus sp. C42_A2020_068]
MTDIAACQLPPFLKPGDLVRVVSTSGALKELEAFKKGVEIWRSRGYRVELGSNWNIRYGYLAGTDTQRRDALAEAWEDPECKAILCARGGYGSARLLENWSWEDGESVGSVGGVGRQSIQNLKWIVGFSDVTGLLWSLAAIGICGVHGSVLTTLASEPNWSIQRLFDCLEGRPLPPLIGKGWGEGKITGILLPANLTVATHLLGTFVQPSFEGAILALEDVTEAPYRIDRMLTQWRMAGAFRGVRGIALGRFSRCDPPMGSSSWSIEEVLRDRLGDLGIPIVSDLPFGHDGVNAALPVGRIARLDAEQGTLDILDNSNEFQGENYSSQ